MKTQPNRITRTRDRKKRGILFLFLLIITSIIAVGIFSIYLINITHQAEDLFGPSTPSLSTFQRYRLSYQLIKEQLTLFSPMDPYGQEIEFTISLNESTGSIIDRLEDTQLITNQKAVRDYIVFTGLDTQLQAGKFVLSPTMTSIEIVNTLIDATPQFVTVNILPGWRLEEIAENIPTTGLNITANEFLQAAYSPPDWAVWEFDIPNEASLEGFLLAGSYELPRESGPDELLATILGQFNQRVTIDIKDGIHRQGLTLYEGVILASIVERENIILDEMPIIASVFLNRIEIGMKLETDPTIQYALGFNTTQGTWWTNPLSLSDLEIDSPYNTYMYNELPPGPIANPSINALQAVAFPAETRYYYFRAACDGSGRHNFSQTFEQHLGFSCP